MSIFLDPYGFLLAVSCMYNIKYKFTVSHSFDQFVDPFLDKINRRICIRIFFILYTSRILLLTMPGNMKTELDQTSLHIIPIYAIAFPISSFNCYLMLYQIFLWKHGPKAAWICEIYAHLATKGLSLLTSNVEVF